LIRLGQVLFMALGGKPEAMEDVAQLLDPLAVDGEPIDPELAAQREFERFSSFATRHNTSFLPAGPEQANPKPKRTKLTPDANDVAFLDG
jgi:hypothetical protein